MTVRMKLNFFGWDVCVCTALETVCYVTCGQKGSVERDYFHVVIYTAKKYLEIS